MPLEDLDRVLAAAATMDGTKATAFLDTVLVPLQPSEAHVERMVAGLDEGKLAVGLAHRLIVTGTAVDKGLAALDARRGIFQTHGLMPLFRVGSAALEHVARHGNAAQQQAIVKLIGRFFAERNEVGGNDGRMIAILGHIPTRAAALRPALEKIAGTTPQKHNEKVIQAAQALLTTIDTAAAKGATENGAGP
jgi:hypothetical protein